MKSKFARSLLAIFLVIQPALASELGDLARRYERDDQKLAAALRYERKKADVRDQVWVSELGDVLKVSRETSGKPTETLSEISLNEDGDVYFAFHKTAQPQPDGGTLVTELRAFYAPFAMLQKTRRTAVFPAGTGSAFPAKAPSEKLDITKLSEDERRGSPEFRLVEEIVKEVRTPACLVQDPAKDAPAEWQRVKVVQQSASPDGRYALAFAPAKADFQWEAYAGPDGLDGYWADEEPVNNFIVDLKTHRVLGKTLGAHIGTKQRYNHRENTMTWSPDSSTFIQLTSGKWSYEACCVGHISDGKLDAMQELGTAICDRAAQFLKAQKQPDYRQHSKEMSIALFGATLSNDGAGTLDAVFQVPKQIDIKPVRVRFRLQTGKSPAQIEILGAAYAPGGQ